MRKTKSSYYQTLHLIQEFQSSSTNEISMNVRILIADSLDTGNTVDCEQLDLVDPSMGR